MLRVCDEAWADGWRSDLALSLADWSDQHIVLSSKDSSEPGPYRTARTPYAREVANCLSPSDPTERVVLVSGAQMGKTRIGLNWIGYVIDIVPGPMLMVEPTVDIAKKVSKQRLATMIETTLALTNKVAEARSRDSGNTMFEKEFPGGILLITGANSAVGLRAMPIRYLFLDEVDGYPLDVENEGDPVGLAEARTTAFARRKVFLTSTPTLKGLSRIEAEYLLSDQRRYFVPCPYCDAYDWIRWERIQWPEGQPEGARLACLSCGALIEERHKTAMLARGQWRATAPGPGKCAGFHISTLYAPLGWRSWVSIVREWVAAQGDTSKLKKFINTVLAETWEEKGDSFSAHDLETRLEDYAAEVPSGVGPITASVDVQGDRLEVAVKGWGAGEESWLIALDQMHGDPAKADVWLELDKLLLQTFDHASGRKLTIRAVAIDSGGLHTEHVYRFVKPRETRRLDNGDIQHVYAIKGRAGSGREILGRPSTSNRYKVKLFPVGVDTAKDTVFSRMRLENPGPGYMHLPAWVDDEYMAQLTAEKALRKYKKGVGTVREYVKLRERNEGLDLEVYALAALHMLGRHTMAELGRLAAENDAAPAPPPQPEESQVHGMAHNQLAPTPRVGGNWATGRKSWIKTW
jgi:phage terminase large subunit GpA-like protein